MDLYELLGVGRNAGPNAIKTAYRALIRKWHPDRKTGDEATQMLQKIKKAYEILSNETKRRKYNAGMRPEQIEMEELNEKTTKTVQELNRPLELPKFETDRVFPSQAEFVKQATWLAKYTRDIETYYYFKKIAEEYKEQGDDRLDQWLEDEKPSAELFKTLPPDMARFVTLWSFIFERELLYGEPSLTGIQLDIVFKNLKDSKSLKTFNALVENDIFTSEKHEDEYRKEWLSSNNIFKRKTASDVLAETDETNKPVASSSTDVPSSPVPSSSSDTAPPIASSSTGEPPTNVSDDPVPVLQDDDPVVQAPASSSTFRAPLQKRRRQARFKKFDIVEDPEALKQTDFDPENLLSTPEQKAKFDKIRVMSPVLIKHAMIRQIFQNFDDYKHFYNIMLNQILKGGKESMLLTFQSLPNPSGLNPLGNSSKLDILKNFLFQNEERKALLDSEYKSFYKFLTELENDPFTFKELGRIPRFFSKELKQKEVANKNGKIIQKLHLEYLDNQINLLTWESKTSKTSEEYFEKIETLTKQAERVKQKLDFYNGIRTQKPISKKKPPKDASAEIEKGADFVPEDFEEAKDILLKNINVIHRYQMDPEKNEEMQPYISELSQQIRKIKEKHPDLEAHGTMYAYFMKSGIPDKWIEKEEYYPESPSEMRKRVAEIKEHIEKNIETAILAAKYAGVYTEKLEHNLRNDPSKGLFTDEELFDFINKKIPAQKRTPEEKPFTHIPKPPTAATSSTATPPKLSADDDKGKGKLTPGSSPIRPPTPIREKIEEGSVERIEFIPPKPIETVVEAKEPKTFTEELTEEEVRKIKESSTQKIDLEPPKLAETILEAKEPKSTTTELIEEEPPIAATSGTATPPASPPPKPFTPPPSPPKPTQNNELEELKKQIQELQQIIVSQREESEQKMFGLINSFWNPEGTETTPVGPSSSRARSKSRGRSRGPPTTDDGTPIKIVSGRARSPAYEEDETPIKSNLLPGNVKFKPPQSPLDVEDGSQIMAPPEHVAFADKRHILNGLSTNPREDWPDDLEPWVNKQSFKEQYQEALKASGEKFAKDFRIWLQSAFHEDVTPLELQSIQNHSATGSGPTQRVFIGPSLTPSNSQLDIDLANEDRVPWTKWRPDSKSAEIKSYLDSYVDKRAEFEKRLIHLIHRGPKTLSEHFYYYKFVIRKEVASPKDMSLFLDAVPMWREFNVRT